MTANIDQRCVDKLRAARSVVVVTGAGISAESGIPTFRDDTTSLWQLFDVKQFASLEGFLKQPEVVWEWYRERRRIMLAAEPNPAHHALAAIERHIPQLTIITQNIDGLHQRAGSQRMIELHGSIMRVTCLQHGHTFTSWSDIEAIPSCPQCQSPLRPNVVWFGEHIAANLLRQAEEACWVCDLCLVVGTSGLVAPAVTFPMTAKAHGATLIDVNPAPTPISKHARYILRGAAGVMLPALVGAAWEGMDAA